MKFIAVDLISLKALGQINNQVTLTDKVTELIRFDDELSAKTVAQSISDTLEIFKIKSYETNKSQGY